MPDQVRARARRARSFEVVFDNVYDWERGTTAAQVEAHGAARVGDRLTRYVFMSSVAAYGDGLNHHEGDALAPDDHPESYVRNKAMTRADAVPPASADRISGGHAAAAVHLRAGESVLPRGVFLGPPARRTSDHHPRRRPSADAVRLREGPGARAACGPSSIRARRARRSTSATSGRSRRSNWCGRMATAAGKKPPDGARSARPDQRSRRRRLWASRPISAYTWTCRPSPKTSPRSRGFWESGPLPSSRSGGDLSLVHAAKKDQAGFHL